MTKAIELIRVSTDRQADKFGIPAQRTANQATAARYGLQMVKSIEISDVSGSSVLLTPEIQTLIELIGSPEIGAVVTKEFSRLMRPERFTDYALLQAFVDSRTTLYLPDGPMDLSDKMGRFMGTIRAAVAGLERGDIRDRSMRGKEECRKAGKKVGNPVPFGCGYDKRRGYFYTAKAALVREAMESVLAGDTNLDRMARTMGVSAPGVAAILRHPIYTGWLVYDKNSLPAKSRADGRQGNSRYVARETNEVIRVKVIDEPLVSDEKFNAVQRILDVKREARRRDRDNGWATFNGFIFCDRCGSLMTPWRTNKNHRTLTTTASTERNAGCATSHMLGQTPWSRLSIVCSAWMSRLQRSSLALLRSCGNEARTTAEH